MKEELYSGKKINIFYFMLIILIVFLIFKPSPTKILGDSLGLKIGDLFLLVLVLGILFIDYKIVLPKNPTFIFLIGLLLIELISLFLGMVQHVVTVRDLFEIFRPFLYLLVYLAGYKIAKKVDFSGKSVKAVKYLLLIFIIFCYFQLFNFLNINEYFQYLYQYSKNRSWGSIYVRIVGTFTNPNYLGVFLTWVNSILLASIILTKKNKIALWFYFFLITFLILCTGSRSSLVVFLLSIFSIIFSYNMDLVREKKYFKSITNLITFFVIFVIFFNIFNGVIIKNFRRLSDAENIFMSFYARVDIWKSSLQLLKGTPLFGVGSYKSIIDIFDNNYINILFKNGILGVTFFVLFLGNNLIKSYKLFLNKHNNFIRTFALGMIGINITTIISMITMDPYNFIQTGSIYILLISIQDTLFGGKDVTIN